MKSTLIQLGCSFIMSLLCAMTAFYSVWPSYAIEILKSDESPLGFKITTNEGSLISSIPMLGSLITTLLAGYVSEAFGRKKPQILCGLLITVAWSLILTARSTLQLIVARFIMGLSSGIVLVIQSVHTAEITQLTIRGSAVTLAGLLYNTGAMMSYLMGWFCSYEVICYISLTATVIYVVMMCFLKETPPYLLKIGKEKEALSSLKFYRGESETTEAILEEISYIRSISITDNTNNDAEKPNEKSENDKLKNDEKFDSNTENTNAWVLLYKVPYNRRALINSVTFVSLAASLGMAVVQTYANKFFASAAPSLSPNMCSVLLALVMTVSCGMMMVITDLVPRRTLMISTCMTATVCLVILGSAMRWPVIPSWVVLLDILTYCLAMQMGLVNLVFVQLSESFSPQVLSSATAIVLCFMFLANFLVLFLFVPGVEYIGIDGTFFVFAVNGAITTLFAYLCMKETRHVPLEEVQKMHADGFLYRKYKKVCDIES